MAAEHDGADGAAGCTLQQTLQSAVQSLQWTYSIFWQLCAQQGVLVWAEGHYNGAIKTRKVVQPAEATAEEACLQRSQQLRELYESLSVGETAGGGQPPARRPCAALSPEDLTESEWFYLMCISFFFPPGVGLPGKAFERQQTVWLSRANEVDSKVFSRAILAKGAQIQTVLCIPVADGVVEMGTTEKVEEDQALIHHVRSFFTGHHHSYSVQTTSKPALSEHSSSNPAPPAGLQLFRSPSLPAMPPAPPDAYRYADEDQEEEDEDAEEEEDEEEMGEDDDDDDDGGAESESDSEAADGGDGGGAEGEALVRPCALAMAAGAAAADAEPSELMQMEMPDEDIRLGSPDDYSNNLDADLRMLGVCCAATIFRSDGAQQRAGAAIFPAAWPLHHDSSMPPSAGATEMQTMSQEDAHYSQTVSTIMQHNSGRWVEYSCSTGYLDQPRQSAFSTWSFPASSEGSLLAMPAGTSQCMLKRALRSAPHVVAAGRFFKGDEASPKGLKEGEAAQRFRRGAAAQDELSASHVLAERRRREKLNERFVVLRSLVPCVTKMDKASILGDTIDYLKQLLRRIQEMEGQIKLLEGDKVISRQRAAAHVASPPADAAHQGGRAAAAAAAGRNYKKKPRVPAAGGDTGEGAAPVEAKLDREETSVQVSIIEADALLELRCPYRDGLLLAILQAIHEVGLETTSVQSSAAAGVFAAEMRAKVKDSVQGKRASIVEVKRALNHVFPQSSCCL